MYFVLFSDPVRDSTGFDAAFRPGLVKPSQEPSLFTHRRYLDTDSAESARVRWNVHGQHTRQLLALSGRTTILEMPHTFPETSKLFDFGA